MQEITGDDLLDSDGQIEIQMPDHWTGEWVCERMIRAFETLRIVGGRVGPKQFGTCWAEYALEYKEVVVRRRAADGEVQRMEEALAWPASYLNGPTLAHSLSRDAVLLWTSVKAAGGDVQPIIRQRYLEACSRAERAASTTNAGLAARRAQAEEDCRKWFEGQLASREKNWAASERAEKLEALERQRTIRLERELAKLPDVRPKPADGANGRVITDRTLRQFRMAGFDVIARGLRRDQVQVR